MEIVQSKTFVTPEQTVRFRFRLQFEGKMVSNSVPKMNQNDLLCSLIRFGNSVDKNGIYWEIAKCSLA